MEHLYNHKLFLQFDTHSLASIAMSLHIANITQAIEVNTQDPTQKSRFYSVLVSRPADPALRLVHVDN